MGCVVIVPQWIKLYSACQVNWEKQTCKTIGMFYSKWIKGHFWRLCWTNEVRNSQQTTDPWWWWYQKMRLCYIWEIHWSYLVINGSDFCLWDSSLILSLEASNYDRIFMVFFSYSTQFSALKYNMVICTTWWTHHSLSFSRLMLYNLCSSENIIKWNNKCEHMC
jgi:hypothetical protein